MEEDGYFKKFIYVPVGIAASGKSTWATDLMNEYSGFVTKYLNADIIRKELYGDPTIQGGNEVWDLLFSRYVEVLKDHTTKLIIVDNTSLTYKIRKRYHKLANTICPMFGNSFEYNLVYFEPDLERSLKWNQKRARHVPDDVIKAQFERIQEPTEIEIEKYDKIIRIK